METLCRLSYWGEQATRIHGGEVTPSVVIAPMTDSHAVGVLRVYQAGIDGGNATFETAVPAWAEFDANYRPDVRLVALSSAGSVLGRGRGRGVSASRVLRRSRG